MYGTVQRKINWMLIIGGLVLVLCGIAIFVAPGFFLEFLTVFAGVGFLISGVSGIGSYIRWRHIIPGAGWDLFMAFLDIVAGILLIIYPIALAGVIPWMFGIMFVAFGILTIVGLMPFGELVPETRVVAILAGILFILVGVLFFVWPESLSIWIAAFALVRGISMIATGFAMRA